MKYRKSDPRWVSDDEMETMQKLWMNGLSVRQIQVIFSEYSRYTIRRYVKDVKRLPRRMRNISFVDLKRTPESIKTNSMMLNNDKAIKQKSHADLKQWRDAFLRLREES